MPLGDATLFELLPRGSAQRPLALKRRHGEALALSSCLPGYDAEEDPDFAAPLPENRNASSEEIKAMQPPPPIHKEQRKMWCFVGLDKASSPGAVEGQEGAKEVYTTEPSRLQEVYFDEKDMRCDVCGLPCKNKLYLFRCYKRREHMSSEEKRLERRLHSFVCYLGIECGKALMGLRTPRMKVKEWVATELQQMELDKLEEMQARMDSTSSEQRAAIAQELLRLSGLLEGSQNPELQKLEELCGTMTRAEDPIRLLARSLQWPAWQLAGLTVHRSGSKPLPAFLREVQRCLHEKAPLPSWEGSRSDLEAVLEVMAAALPLRFRLFDNLAGEKEIGGRGTALKLYYLKAAQTLHAPRDQQVDIETKKDLEKVLTQAMALILRWKPLGPAFSLAGLRCSDDEMLSSKGLKPCYEDVLWALRSIQWPDCVSRKNVMELHQRSIQAMSLGCVRPQYGRELCLARSSRRLPTLTELVVAFGREIFRLDSSFCFTSVQANKDYAAKLHTDRNNFGKSFIIGLGDYEGGQLWVYDGDGALKEGLRQAMKITTAIPSWGLKEGDTVMGRLLDIKNTWRCFDGRRPHMAMPFTGERYSLVFYTRREARDGSAVPLALRQRLAELGFPLPEESWFLREGEPVRKKGRVEQPGDSDSDDENERWLDPLDHEGVPYADLAIFSKEMQVDWSSLKFPVGLISCNAGVAAALVLRDMLPAAKSKVTIGGCGEETARLANNFALEPTIYKDLESFRAAVEGDRLSDKALEHILHGVFTAMPLLFTLAQGPEDPVFQCIQVLLQKRQPPLALLEVSDWGRLGSHRPRALKYLRSRLQALPYDFEALDFALPSPLRGSVLLIFMARKGVAAPTALRRAAQVARLLRRRLPERRLHECLLAEEDPKVKDLKVKGVAKRARQVCRSIKHDVASVVVDLSDLSESRWSDNGLLPNERSGLHYVCGRERPLLGCEELVLRGYPYDAELLDGLSDEGQRKLAAGSSSLPLLAAALAALLAAAQGLWPGLACGAELPLEEIRSDEEPEEQVTELQNKAVVWLGLLQRAEKQAKSKGKRGGLASELAQALSERGKEVQEDSTSFEETKLLDLVPDWEVRSARLVGWSRFDLPRDDGPPVTVLPWAWAMSWVLEAARALKRSSGPKTLNVINHGLDYLSKCLQNKDKVLSEEDQAYAQKLCTQIDLTQRDELESILESRRNLKTIKAFKGFVSACFAHLAREGLQKEDPHYVFMSELSISAYVDEVLRKGVLKGDPQLAQLWLVHMEQRWHHLEEGNAWDDFCAAGGEKAMVDLLAQAAQVPQDLSVVQKLLRKPLLCTCPGFLRAALGCLRKEALEDAKGLALQRVAELLQRGRRVDCLALLKELRESPLQARCDVTAELLEAELEAAQMLRSSSDAEQLQRLLQRFNDAWLAQSGFAQGDQVGGVSNWALVAAEQRCLRGRQEVAEQLEKLRKAQEDRQEAEQLAQAQQKLKELSQLLTSTRCLGQERPCLKDEEKYELMLKLKQDFHRLQPAHLAGALASQQARQLLQDVVSAAGYFREIKGLKAAAKQLLLDHRLPLCLGQVLERGGLLLHLPELTREQLRSLKLPRGMEQRLMDKVEDGSLAAEKIKACLPEGWQLKTSKRNEDYHYYLTAEQTTVRQLPDPFGCEVRAEIPKEPEQLKRHKEKHAKYIYLCGEQQLHWCYLCGTYADVDHLDEKTHQERKRQWHDCHDSLKRLCSEFDELFEPPDGATEEVWRCEAVHVLRERAEEQVLASFWHLVSPGFRLDVEHVAQLPEPDLVEYPSLPKPREDFLLFPNGLDPNQLPRQLEDSDLMSQGLERRGEGYWCHICRMEVDLGEKGVRWHLDLAAMNASKVAKKHRDWKKVYDGWSEKLQHGWRFYAEGCRLVKRGFVCGCGKRGEDAAFELEGHLETNVHKQWRRSWTAPSAKVQEAWRRWWEKEFPKSCEEYLSRQPVPEKMAETVEIFAEPELPLPGEDFPDLSDGSMFQGGKCILCDPPEEVPEKGQESHLKTHQVKDRDDCLKAFSCIKERGDTLWRQLIKLKDGKLVCDCGKETPWWCAHRWIQEHVATKNHKKWANWHGERPAQPWEAERKEHWLASFGRAEGRAKRRRVEAPRAARETREALEEQVHDLLQEGTAEVRGMKMAVEFQAPTDNELAGHSEACRARHFPELQPPLCYGWSSFKSKKKQKEAWVWCLSCRVYVASYTWDVQKNLHSKCEESDYQGHCAHSSAL